MSWSLSQHRLRRGRVELSGDLRLSKAEASNLPRVRSHGSSEACIQWESKRLLEDYIKESLCTKSVVLLLSQKAKQDQSNLELVQPELPTYRRFRGLGFRD